MILSMRAKKTAQVHIQFLNYFVRLTVCYGYVIMDKLVYIGIIINLGGGLNSSVLKRIACMTHSGRNMVILKGGSITTPLSGVTDLYRKFVWKYTRST